ncbi:MAG: hypothetical protein ACSLFB_02630 [Acidimicrobiales bacterium]
MQIVAVILALMLTFVIAAVVIGREVNRLIEQVPRPIFDLDEAVVWVSERLPFEVSAVLSYDDVRHILVGYLDELSVQGAAPDYETFVVDETAVSAIMTSANDLGLEFTVAHVRAVIELQVDYLGAIGAAGPPQVL